MRWAAARIPGISDCAAEPTTAIGTRRVDQRAFLKDSQEAALRQVKEAIQLWIDTAREFGEPVPKLKGERLMLA